MYKIGLFFNTVWRFIKISPAFRVAVAAIAGVAAAAVVAVFAVRQIQSAGIKVSAGSVIPSSIGEAQESEAVSSEPEIPPPAEQPVEKQVTYKGQQINVVKNEIAEKNSKEDSQNGNYKKEPPQTKPQAAAANPYDKAPSSIPYKKPVGNFAGGIDVSSHNGEIDWEKVKSAGVGFVMVRCGYRGYLTGKIVTDATFYYNIENACKNGIDVGVYFYSTATSEREALEEAAYVTERIKEVESKGVVLKYPVAYDFEEFYNNDSRTRAKGLTAAQISANTTAFLDYIESKGYTPMLYAGKNPIKKYWTSGMASKYNFWLAHYTEATEYEGKFFMWQYTSSGTVEGILGRVDFNICGFEDNCNAPRFKVCKAEGVLARVKPNPNSTALLTLDCETVYLCRNTYDCGYNEIKVSGKYYYVLSDELQEIPFEESGKDYKTVGETVLYSQPFDTYKSDVVIPPDTKVSVVGIWKDKWAKTEYEENTYYVSCTDLEEIINQDESEVSSEEADTET